MCTTAENRAEKTEDLMEDGEINTMKSMTGWKLVTRAVAINLHQSTVKDKKCRSLTKRSMAIPPPLSRVNDNIHYVSRNLAREPQGFTSEDRVMTAREEHHKFIAEACSDALDVICVCKCVCVCVHSVTLRWSLIFLTTSALMQQRFCCSQVLNCGSIVQHSCAWKLPQCGKWSGNDVRHIPMGKTCLLTAVQVYMVSVCAHLCSDRQQKDVTLD